MTNNIKFVSKYISEDDSVFGVRIPCVRNKIELLEELNKKLHFPYFGYNWDSMTELLEDFYWITQYHIHIYHESVICVEEYELANYIDIIYDNYLWWNKYNDHQVLFLFSEEERPLLEKVISAVEIYRNEQPSKRM